MKEPLNSGFASVEFSVIVGHRNTIFFQKFTSSKTYAKKGLNLFRRHRQSQKNKKALCFSVSKLTNSNAVSRFTFNRCITILRERKKKINIQVG